ncbi:hypothetical protein BHQ18_23315 [Mycolicibacterium flavescens]|uniref:STAS domain-containing protein n=1 Tax=Mycolicibacterium flavescens TaxID=1776 RepID=A0A1E3RCD2_MYCFV|nr:hypothetical protein BHQ18_23315 [Mycolicibacterium flavescens]
MTCGAWAGPGAANVTIFATGEVDAANAKEFSLAVCEAVGDAERVLLDLSALEFIAIDAVAALHAVNAHLTRAGVPWSVLPGAAVARVLAICDREHVIPLLDAGPTARRGETVLRLVQPA